MASLVSLALVKAVLRVDADDDDVMLQLLIEAASVAIITHLKSQAAQLVEFDSAGEVVNEDELPPAISMATIILVGYWYREPDADENKAFGEGALPAPVIALLLPLRDPALV